MNQYGELAKSHWARFLPRRYSQIADPDSFFSILGQEVAEEIDQLTQAYAGEDPPHEDYLGKLGRLNAARQQAREKVLAERVLLPAEPGSPMDEPEQDEPLSNGMSTDWIPVRESPNHPWWREQASQAE